MEPPVTTPGDVHLLHPADHLLFPSALSPAPSPGWPQPELLPSPGAYNYSIDSAFFPMEGGGEVGSAIGLGLGVGKGGTIERPKGMGRMSSTLSGIFGINKLNGTADMYTESMVPMSPPAETSDPTIHAAGKNITVSNPAQECRPADNTFNLDDSRCDSGSTLSSGIQAISDEYFPRGNSSGEYDSLRRHSGSEASPILDDILRHSDILPTMKTPTELVIPRAVVRPLTLSCKRELGNEEELCSKTPNPWEYRPVPLYAGQDFEAWRKNAAVGGGTRNNSAGFAFSSSPESANLASPPSITSPTVFNSFAAATSPNSASNMHHPRRLSDIHPGLGDLAQYSTVGSIEGMIAMCKNGLVGQPSHLPPDSTAYRPLPSHDQRTQYNPLPQGYKGSIDPAMINGSGPRASFSNGSDSNVSAVSTGFMNVGGALGGGDMAGFDLTYTMDPSHGVHGTMMQHQDPLFSNDTYPTGNHSMAHSRCTSIASLPPPHWTRASNTAYSPQGNLDQVMGEFASSPEAMQEIVEAGSGNANSSGHMTRNATGHLGSSGNVGSAGRKGQGVSRKEKGGKVSKSKTTAAQRKQIAANTISEHQAELKRKAAEAIEALQFSQDQEAALRSPPTPPPVVKLEQINASSSRIDDLQMDDGEGDGDGGDDAMTAGEFEGQLGIGGKKNRVKRKEMNRVAARRHREKTKEKLRSLEERKAWLESTVREYEGTMKKMQETLFRMQKENEVLRRVNFQQSMTKSGTATHTLPSVQVHAGAQGC